MRIGLVDVDGHNFPNIALMKLSAWRKRRGDTVEFADPAARRYDKVYMSKGLYLFARLYGSLRLRVVRAELLTIRRFFPKRSSIYVRALWSQRSLWVFTRGCVNRCPWCVVPHKEGEVRAHADIEEFLDRRRSAVLLDNN